MHRAVASLRLYCSTMKIFLLLFTRSSEFVHMHNGYGEEFNAGDWQGMRN